MIYLRYFMIFSKLQVSFVCEKVPAKLSITKKNVIEAVQLIYFRSRNIEVKLVVSRVCIRAWSRLWL